MEITIVERTCNKLTILKNGRKLTSEGVKQSGRTCYLFKNFVVKFSYEACNIREVERYKKVEKKDRRYFAKILGEGFFNDRHYIIADRVKTDYAARMTEKQKETIHKIAKKYSISDYSVDGETYHEITHNVTLDVKNRIKFFDYTS